MLTCPHKAVDEVLCGDAESIGQLPTYADPPYIPRLKRRGFYGVFYNQYTVKLLLKETRGNYELIPGLLAESAVRIADSLIERLES